jgi:hypothetical protein
MPDERELPDDDLEEQEEPIAEEESYEGDSYEDELKYEDESVGEDDSYEDVSEGREVDPNPPERKPYRPSDPSQGHRGFDDQGYDPDGLSEDYSKSKP